MRLGREEVFEDTTGLGSWLTNYLTSLILRSQRRGGKKTDQAETTTVDEGGDVLPGLDRSLGCTH